jgi:transmembrane protein EpsG
MEIMWLNLGFVYLASWFARYFSYSTNQISQYIRPRRLFMFMVILSFIIVSGLRKNVGDTYFYMHSYELSNFPLANIDFTGEFGFYYLQHILHKISDDPQILIFVTALITNLIIVLVLYKYSRIVEISIYVYITSGLFTVTMNGIRQSMAAAIIFAGTKYLIDGNWKRFIFIVLIASTIHQSALIFIPIYFIVQKRAWTKLTFLLLFLAVIIAFEFNTFSALLFNALDNTKYEHYSNFSEGGANYLRVLVMVLPLLIAFLGREKLKEIWPKNDVIVNLSLLGFIFMLIATQNWIFARFDIYFNLYSLILISWILKLFKERDSWVIYYCILVCYFIFFYYEEVVSFNFYYKSDFIHL